MRSPISAYGVWATSVCQSRVLEGRIVSHHAAKSRPSFARQRGRTITRAASAPQIKTTASAWRNAVIGKSNQSAPKDHAAPIASSSQPSASQTVRRMERSEVFICLQGSCLSDRSYGY